MARRDHQQAQERDALSRRDDDHPVRTEGNEITHLIAVKQDIAQRKLAENSCAKRPP